VAARAKLVAHGRLPPGASRPQANDAASARGQCHPARGFAERQRRVGGIIALMDVSFDMHKGQILA